MNQIHVLMFILTRYAYLRTKSVGKWFLLCMCASQVGALGFGTRVSRYDWRPTSTYRLLLKHTARGNVYEEKHVLDRWRVSSSTMHTFISFSLPFLPYAPSPAIVLSSSHPSSPYLHDRIPLLTVFHFLLLLPFSPSLAWSILRLLIIHSVLFSSSPPSPLRPRPSFLFPSSCLFSLTCSHHLLFPFPSTFSPCSPYLLFLLHFFTFLYPLTFILVVRLYYCDVLFRSWTFCLAFEHITMTPTMFRVIYCIPVRFQTIQNCHDCHVMTIRTR